MKPKIKSEASKDAGTVGNWEEVEESEDYYRVNRADEQTDSNLAGVSDSLLGKRAHQPL